MENKISNYGMQCPVIFGVDSVETLPAEIQKMGFSSAFVIYDQGVKATGIGDRVMKILADGGIKATAFDDITAEPIAHVVNAAADAAKAAGAEVVIGVGGGSPLDTAKLVAVLLDNPGKIEDYFLSNLAKGINVMFTLTKHAPLIGVPTSSGTGAEVTCVAVLSDDDHNKDGVLVNCNLALVDPTLTYTVPPAVTANGGLDAMAHALEAITAGPLEPMTGQGNDPFSTVIGLKAVELINDNLEKVYDNGSDTEARINMSKAANWAGIAFSNTGVSFGHCIAHEFGSAFGIGHGLACAWTVPVTLYQNALWDKEVGLALAKAMKIEVAADADNQAIADALLARGKAISAHCHIPSLSSKGITREAAVATAQAAIDLHPDQYANTIVPLTPEKFAELIGMVYDVNEETQNM